MLTADAINTSPWINVCQILYLWFGENVKGILNHFKAASYLVEICKHSDWFIPQNVKFT